MKKKNCRKCGKAFPETHYRTLRKRSDGTYKRSNLCAECSTSTLSMAYPARVEFSEHAKKRCKLRQIDTSRLTRTLMAIPLASGKHELPIPESPVYVVYVDDLKLRIRTVVTAVNVTRSIGRDMEPDA